jgi:hypothetical protein
MRIHAQIRRQLPHRRQGVLAAQGAEGDGSADLVDDLDVDRAPVGRVDGDVNGRASVLVC